MDGCVFIAPHDILIQLIDMICKPSVVMLTVFANLSLCIVDGSLLYHFLKVYMYRTV